MKKKRNFVYSKTLFHLFNFIFFFIYSLVSIFYGIFIWPIKKLIRFYNFLIQVNICLKIEKKLKTTFETNLKNMACENNLGSADIKNLMKSFNYFEDKKNHPDIVGNINETLCTFDYNYRGIYLNITKSFKKRSYFIEMKLNDKPLIDIEKPYSFRSSRYSTLFL